MTSTSSPERRTLVPHYPTDASLRILLSLLDGVPRKTLTGMFSTLAGQRGTPQAQVDWSEPDSWLSERLSGEELTLGRRIWEGSNQVVNPRHIRDGWSVATRHDLIGEASGGVLRITDRGREFLTSPDGAIARGIDAHEGLVKILELIVERGSVALSDLEEPWRNYVQEISSIRSDIVARQSLSKRLRNLVERGYVERSGGTYQITPAGTTYLGERVDTEVTVEPDEDRKLLSLLTEHRQRFREQLREELSTMDPFAFERLIGQLLEAMGYVEVTVTAPSGDGGVDVTGKIQLGITDVREVIQVKRHARNIPRHTLDALRGSLHRFEAVRGTIITTGDFARGTVGAAFERGAAPITLIDGEKLIDLLIEHKVGVRKRPIELLEIDRSAFAEPIDEELLDESHESPQLK